MRLQSTINGYPGAPNTDVPITTTERSHTICQRREYRFTRYGEDRYEDNPLFVNLECCKTLVGQVALSRG